MLQQFLDLHKSSFDAAQEVLGKLHEGLVELQKETSKEEYIDAVFAIRKTHQLLADLVKALTKFDREISDKIVTVMALELKEGVLKRGSIKTEYTTAVCKVQNHLPVPKRKSNPELYANLCRYCGIPEDAIKSGVFNLTWDGFSEFLSEKLAEGRPLPQGVSLSEMYIVKSLVLRQNKSLLEGENDG